LSTEERQKLGDYGFEIGSHGFRHQRITHLKNSEAFEELRQSKLVLEKEFQKSIPSYAFTYGVAEEPHFEMARRAGYDFAVMTDFGGLHLEENPHRIFRVNIFPNESCFSFWKKTCWWYRYYFYFKKS